MNIFYLDENIDASVQYHVDKHVVKMILEHTQMLSTAHRVLDGHKAIDYSTGRKQTTWHLSDPSDSLLYKATHINHPSAVWARSSLEHYIYLANMTKALCREYTHRYGKIHKSQPIVEWLSVNFPRNIRSLGFSQPPCAMPARRMIATDAVENYRNYYNQDKKHLFAWTNRSKPSWAM